ncbi:hypothetical protein ACPCAJ_01865 [Streptomyces griseoincarnatus]
MADGEREEPRGEGPAGQEVPRKEQSEPPQAEFRMELRDTLPGDRAVIGVEQEGEFMWLASKKYVHPKAVAEFEDQLRRIVEQGWWVQNWPGIRST